MRVVDAAEEGGMYEVTVAVMTPSESNDRTKIDRPSVDIERLSQHCLCSCIISEVIVIYVTVTRVTIIFVTDCEHEILQS